MIQFKQPSSPEVPGATPDVVSAVKKFETDQQVDAQAEYVAKKLRADRKARREVEQEEIASRRVVEVLASSVQEVRTKWLWKGRIPLGEITLLAGKGGVGKSTVATQIAAYVTIGDLKGEFYGTPRHVVMAINEDDLRRTVVPRLKAAGADLDLVHFVKMQAIDGNIDRISLPHDIDNVKALIKQYNAALFVLDPMSSNLAGKRNDQDDMRPVMERIRRDLAEATECAVLGLAHVKKGRSADLLEAIMGSSELGNIARAAIGVVRDPDEDDAIILSQEKNNLGELSIESFRYRIHKLNYVADNGEVIPTSRLEWLDPTDTKASDIIADTENLDVRPRVAAAEEFIRDYLVSEGGQALKKDVLNHGRNEGHKSSTLERAARKLKLISIPSGRGAARLWSFPPPDSQ